MAVKIFRIVAKLLTYLLCAATLLSAWGGYVPPNLWATPSIFVLAFPYLALATLIAGIAWFASRRIFITCVCGGVLVLYSGALFSHFPLHGEKKVQAGERPFTLMTYNIHQAVDVRPEESRAGQNRAFRELLDCGADIIAVQELVDFRKYHIDGVPDADVETLLEKYPYCLTVGDPASLVLLSRFPAAQKESDEFFQLCEIEVYGRRLWLLNVHLASFLLSQEERRVVSGVRGVRSAKRSIDEFKGSISEKLKVAFREHQKEADKLRGIINSHPGPLIICGDFNDVPASWAYNRLKGDDLQDAWSKTSAGMTYTFNLYGLYFRIDQILYRPEGLRALKTDRLKIDASDHFPMMARFAITP